MLEEILPNNGNTGGTIPNGILSVSLGMNSTQLAKVRAMGPLVLGSMVINAGYGYTWSKIGYIS